MRKTRFLRKTIKTPHTKTVPKNILEIEIPQEKRQEDAPCQKKAKIIPKISQIHPHFQKLYPKARIWKKES